MKRKCSVYSSFFVLLFIFLAVARAETIIEKYTLQPGETKQFSIDADAKIKVGFRPDSSQSKNCKNNCVEISQKGGITMASKFGAAIGMKPSNGKISGSLKNLEDFPIDVELFQK